jgi:hypothetical protein
LTISQKRGQASKVGTFLDKNKQMPAVTVKAAFDSTPTKNTVGGYENVERECEAYLEVCFVDC